jgi:hypothetical protein
MTIGAEESERRRFVFMNWTTSVEYLKSEVLSPDEETLKTDFMILCGHKRILLLIMP